MRLGRLTEEKHTAFTADSKIGDILKEKPKAVELFGKYAGIAGTVSPQMVQMAMGMTLRQVAGYAKLDQARLDALVAELNRL